MNPRRPIIVMYHYVWPDDREVPRGIRPLRVSQFNAQLDWIAERYEIVNSERFLETYRDSADRPPCLLTFDDGTRDHAEVVTPLLAARGLSGVFFVPTGPMSRKMMPLTHALHWLLGQDDHAIWEAFVAQATHSMSHGEAALGSEEEALRIYHYETPLRARIKYAANMALPPAQTSTVLRTLVEIRGRTMSDLAAEWFVSAAQIAEMDRAGMTIGMHGVTHQSLNTLGAAGIRSEIAECSDDLAVLLGKRPMWWACPFGGSGASTEATEAMIQSMESVGVRAAVSTRAAVVETQSHPWAMPRFDAVNLPPLAAIPPEGVG